MIEINLCLLIVCNKIATEIEIFLFHFRVKWFYWAVVCRRYSGRSYRSDGSRRHLAFQER